MDNWRVFSTTDLVTWTLADTLLPSAMHWDDQVHSCWATDAAHRAGQYYVYVSAGPTQIGVVAGSSPHGPFTDPIGKPLVPNGLVPTQARDPGVLQDDDGSYYIVFGTFDYYVARLGDDLVSLAEARRMRNKKNKKQETTKNKKKKRGRRGTGRKTLIRDRTMHETRRNG